MDNKENENNSQKKENLKNPVKPRCINIDCAFNSSLQPTDKRNICNHPNVFVDQEALEITIAICSEFRSKKDYVFEKPDKLIDLKDKSVFILTSEKKDVTKSTAVEIVETKDLNKEEIVTTIPPFDPVREFPTIIETGEEDYLTPKLTTSPNFYLQVLKRYYQENLKRGIILSVILHIIAIGFFYLFLGSDDEENELPAEQRIVVVEDIEQPKFIPPDLDVKEEPEETGDVTENRSEIRPQITRKDVTPRINRPDNTPPADTTSTASTDTTGRPSTGLNDSLLALYSGDTNRLMLADSLKSTFAENEVGLSLWYPKNWKLRDSRTINPNEQSFSGVIINTDSLSEDPGAVTMFILLENDNSNSFNKTKFKNSFQMDDTNSTAFSSDPFQLGSKKISYQFYIFAPTAKMFVNTETKNELFEKYKPYIDAIVRSIKIVKNNTAGNP